MVTSFIGGAVANFSGSNALYGLGETASRGGVYNGGTPTVQNVPPLARTSKTKRCQIVVSECSLLS